MLLNSIRFFFYVTWVHNYVSRIHNYVSWIHFYAHWIHFYAHRIHFHTTCLVFMVIPFYTFSTAWNFSGL
ncbi:MAG: hypothetical protein SH856_12100 [Flavobacteriales bacterium]|nr:hypothetical protein [Flavobacteriales bacterium]